MTNDPNEIHCRINVARQLAENLGHQEKNSCSLGGIEAGLSSYLLSSSLDHLMWWAAMESKKNLTNEILYTNVSFGNASCEKWLKQCKQWLREPYLSRILSVSKLAWATENYKWLKTFANQDKHRHTFVIKDERDLSSTKEKLSEAAKFLDYSVRHVKEGTPVPLKLDGIEKTSDKPTALLDSEQLEMLIFERMKFVKKTIKDLEMSVCEHLKVRHGTAKIEKNADSNGKFGFKVSAKNVPVPIKWSIKAGLIGHMLRSVLDHMVWTLVVRNEKKPTSRNQFPIPEPGYTPNSQSEYTKRMREQMLENLSDYYKQKIESIFNPLHPSMGGVFAELIYLDRLRKTDAHRHVPIAISTTNWMSDEWNNRASEALDRGDPPPDPTPDDVKFIVCFCDQMPSDRSMRYGGDIIQSCRGFLAAVNSVAAYLNFDVSVAR